MVVPPVAPPLSVVRQSFVMHSGVFSRRRLPVVTQGALTAVMLLVTLKYSPLVRVDAISREARAFGIAVAAAVLFLALLSVAFFLVRKGAFIRLQASLMIPAALLCAACLTVFATLCLVRSISILAATWLGFGFGFGAVILIASWIVIFAGLEGKEVLFYSALALCFSTPFTCTAALLGERATYAVLAVGLVIGTWYPVSQRGQGLIVRRRPQALASHQDAPNLSALGTATRQALRSPLLSMWVFGLCSGLTYDERMVKMSPWALAMPLVAAALIVPLTLGKKRSFDFASAYPVAIPAVAAVMLVISSIPASGLRIAFLSFLTILLFSLLGILAQAYLVHVIQTSVLPPVLLALVFQVFLQGSPLLGNMLNAIPLSARCIAALALTSLLLVYLVGSDFHRLRHSRTEEREQISEQLEVICRDISDRWKLSKREHEVLLLLSRGHSSIYIGKNLFISENTARTHIRNIYRKTGVTTREGLLDLIGV